MKKIQLKLIILLALLIVGKYNFSQEVKTIHVFVALCDNENQGIVPVPAKIGNGQDPYNNLYWGAGYGVKTFFSRSEDWKLIKKYTNPDDEILERVLFKHTLTNTYLLADAYDGSQIHRTTIDFLRASSGEDAELVDLDTLTLSFGGKSNLLAYVGHDGLMDFNIEMDLKPKNTEKRDVIILACYSKKYFKDFIKAAGANPLIWTSGLMAPEAYTLKWAIDGWILDETDEQIRERAAKAYHHYQKCGMNGARNLMVTGF